MSKKVYIPLFKTTLLAKKKTDKKLSHKEQEQISDILSHLLIF